MEISGDAAQKEMGGLSKQRWKYSCGARNLTWYRSQSKLEKETATSTHVDLRFGFPYMHLNKGQKYNMRLWKSQIDQHHITQTLHKKLKEFFLVSNFPKLGHFPLHFNPLVRSPPYVLGYRVPLKEIQHRSLQIINRVLDVILRVLSTLNMGPEPPQKRPISRE
ncbi:hypothetical protein CFP56_017470 [Quercus suber]|uniref:Uncharacterized protein n=1 Tax=Quercus suber TaxID=58331 RepID=A0AAW0KN80_QUESU